MAHGFTEAMHRSLPWLNIGWSSGCWERKWRLLEAIT
jgi:hypothetical protein